MILRKACGERVYRQYAEEVRHDIVTHFLEFKRRGLELPVPVRKTAEKPVSLPRYKLIFQEGAVEADEDGASRVVLYMHLQRSRFSCFNPVVTDYHYNGTDFFRREVAERDYAAAVFPVTRIMAQKPGDAVYPHVGKRFYPGLPHAFYVIEGRCQFPQKQSLRLLKTGVRQKTLPKGG
jgi:hypothetical protein